MEKADKNTILDARVYNVEFSDSENAELGANIITECMYDQCDIEGNQYRPWITFTFLLPGDEGTNDMSFSLLALSVHQKPCAWQSSMHH